MRSIYRFLNRCCCLMLLSSVLAVSYVHATPTKFETTFTVPAATASNPATLSVDVLAQKLISASGLDQMLEQIPSAIERGYLTDSESAEVDVYTGITPDELTAQLNYAFSHARMLATVNRSLSADLTADSMSAALTFLESPVGRRIVKQEVERSSASLLTDVSEYGESLSASPFRQVRKQILKELDLAWALTETSVDMLIDMQIAMSIAMMPSMPRDRQVDAATLSNNFESQRPELLSHYQEDTLNTLFFIYAKLTVDEIREYIAFATSEEGQRYVNAMNRAHKRAMLEGSYLWGQTLGDAIAESQDLTL